MIKVMTKKSVVGLLALVNVLALFVFMPQKALAAVNATGEYVDAGQIKLNLQGDFVDKGETLKMPGEITLEDAGPYDTTPEYVKKLNNCDTKFKASGVGSASGELEIAIRNISTNECSKTKLPITLGKPENATIFFNAPTASSITDIRGKRLDAVPNQPNVYSTIEKGDSLNGLKGVDGSAFVQGLGAALDKLPGYTINYECALELTVAADKLSGKLRTVCTVKTKAFGPCVAGIGPGCEDTKKNETTRDVKIRPPGDPNATSEAAGTIVPSCETDLLDPLAWLGCQVLNSANKAIRRIDVAISQQLAFQQDEDVKAFELNTTSLNDFNKNKDPGKAYYGIWSIFRFLASALIILAAIAMVIGQSLSFGPFDAYTVKKLLPKILAAVVFVNLSWELCVLAIQLVNGLGYGIRALMYAPFEANGTPIDQFFNVSTFESLAGGGGVIVGGFAIASSFGIMGILSLAITALLALAVGFAIIILRKVLITLLVVMAPIAIASMILPNTDKLWKFWKDSFTKGLMMFPIIMALLASGRIFSYMTAIGETGEIGDRPYVNQDTSTIANAGDAFQGAIGSGQGLMIQVVAILAYFAPYFLIPATFKFAGGALTTLTGQLNNRSKGLFDRNKNWRNNTKKARKENAAYNNYANRDSGGYRGRKARIALGSQAIGAGHSPLQRGDWNRFKAAQATQADKVLSQQFEDYGKQMSSPTVTPDQLRTSARSRNVEESAAAIKELLRRREHTAVRELQQEFAADNRTDQWEAQKKHIRSELSEAGPDLGMRLTAGDAAHVDNLRRNAFATANNETLAAMPESAWTSYFGLQPGVGPGSAANARDDLVTQTPLLAAKLSPRARNATHAGWVDQNNNPVPAGTPGARMGLL